MRFSNDVQREKAAAALKDHPYLGELRNLLLSMGGDQEIAAAEINARQETWCSRSGSYRFRIRKQPTGIVMKEPRGCYLFKPHMDRH